MPETVWQPFDTEYARGLPNDLTEGIAPNSSSFFVIEVGWATDAPRSSRSGPSCCRMRRYRPSRRTFAKEIQVLIDRRSTEPMARRLLENRVESDITSHHAGLFPPAVRVGHQDSAGSAGIQVADFVAGAVFQGLERPHTSYLDLISGNVVSGRRLW